MLPLLVGLYLSKGKWVREALILETPPTTLQSKQLTILWSAKKRPETCCICSKECKQNFSMAYLSGRVIDGTSEKTEYLACAAFHCQATDCAKQALEIVKHFLGTRGNPENSAPSANDTLYVACQKCKKVSSKDEIKHCPHCHATMYCSDVCRTQDEKNHFKECGGIKR
jgi:hypothetical protein